MDRRHCIDSSVGMGYSQRRTANRLVTLLDPRRWVSSAVGLALLAALVVIVVISRSS
jgi:hypothetical protein